MTTQIDIERFLRDSFSESWDLFRRDPALYIVAGIVVLFLGIITIGVLAGPLIVGFIGVVRARREGVQAGVGDVFKGLSQFLSAFLVSLVIIAGVIIGSALLVVPGLVVSFLVMYAFQIIAYQDAGTGASLRGSFDLIKAQFGASLVLFLVLAILNALGGLVVLGSLLTFPFALVVLTVAYEKLAAISPPVPRQDPIL